MMRLTSLKLPHRKLRYVPFSSIPGCILGRSITSYNGHLITRQMDALLNTAWIRHHLFILGYDLVKLELYQKLSHLLGMGGGGILKNIVFELSSFLKRELKPGGNSSKIAQQLKEMVDFNYDEFERYGRDYNMLCYSNRRISEFKWFFISVGYHIISLSTITVEKLAGQIIDIYLKSTNNRLLELIEFSQDEDVLNSLREYYENVPINYRKLYNKSPRRINLIESRNFKLELPPLPRIKDKVLLTKSLMHQELYRALFSSGHGFAEIMSKKRYSLDYRSHNFIKYDLSFLDGLGDFFLARESSNLLYRLRYHPLFFKSNQFGKKSYNVLRTILTTNTLLSKLAIAYNLHEGFGDSFVQQMLKNDYAPNLTSSKQLTISNSAKIIRYEEEFMADYFESYIGALFLEDSSAAQAFVCELYERILCLVVEENDIMTQNGDYKAWSRDIIGRVI